jgi:hypothetical protein
VRSNTAVHCARASAGQLAPGAGNDSSKIPIIGDTSETRDGFAAETTAGSEATAFAPSAVPASRRRATYLVVAPSRPQKRS